MLVFHIRFSKKTAAVCASVALMVTATALLLSGCLKNSEPSQSVSAASNEERIAYLNSLGWDVAEEPIETLQLGLPDDLAADYGEYCKLQKDQGLPFSDYGGKQAERYTYAVTNYPDIPQGVQANLYVCNGRIIGGDIIVTGEGGFRSSLSFPKK